MTFDYLLHFLLQWQWLWCISIPFKSMAYFCNVCILQLCFYKCSKMGLSDLTRQNSCLSHEPKTLCTPHYLLANKIPPFQHQMWFTVPFLTLPFRPHRHPHQACRCYQLMFVRVQCVGQRVDIVIDLGSLDWTRSWNLSQNKLDKTQWAALCEFKCRKL